MRGGKSRTGTRERRRLRSGEESDEEGECDRQQHEDREPPALLTLSAGQPACAPRRSTRRGWLLGFAHVATLVAGALVAMSHVHQGCVKRLARTRPLFCSHLTFTGGVRERAPAWHRAAPAPASAGFRAGRSPRRASSAAAVRRASSSSCSRDLRATASSSSSTGDTPPARAS